MKIRVFGTKVPAVGPQTVMLTVSFPVHINIKTLYKARAGLWSFADRVKIVLYIRTRQKQLEGIKVAYYTNVDLQCQSFPFDS